MNKRILSILLCLALVASLLVLAVSVSAAPVNPQLTVTADKDKAAPGETVNFSVVLGPVTDIGSLAMHVVIPDGLTYVSGKLDPGARDALGFNDNEDLIEDIHLKWTASSKMITGDNGFADINTTEPVTLVNFSCTVDEGATGDLVVTLDELEMASLQTDDFYTDLFTVNDATVTVTGSSTEAPPTTAEPTQEATQEATQTSTTAPTQESTEAVTPTEEHHHSLKFVDEVPATPEKDGVKAHFVCEGCGKMYSDGTATVEVFEADLVIPYVAPTTAPTAEPTEEPTAEPTNAPEPTEEPTAEPTNEPTEISEGTEPATEVGTEAGTESTVKPTTAPSTKDTSTKDTSTKDTSKTATSPKTGDSTHMYLWMLIMLASLAGVAAVLYTAKRKGIFTK